MEQQNNTVLKIYSSVCCGFGVLPHFSLLFLCLVAFVTYFFDCVRLFMAYCRKNFLQSRVCGDYKKKKLVTFLLGFWLCCLVHYNSLS
jgi:hypothetical protein